MAWEENYGMYGEEAHNVEINIAEDVPRILLLGPRRSGKSSMSEVGRVPGVVISHPKREWELPGRSGRLVVELNADADARPPPRSLCVCVCVCVRVGVRWHQFQGVYYERC